MDDRITLDRETFKALAVDTRVKILRILDDRQNTLSDLAEELGMAPSTIKEHLDTLVSAGLIQQIDKGMKWKYYRLTSKGKEIINPYEKKVIIMLATTILAAFASMYVLVGRLQNLMPAPMAVRGISENMAPAARGGEVLMDNGPSMLKAAVPEAANETMQATYGAADASFNAAEQWIPQMPYVELGAVILFSVLIGVCIGYLIKKKKTI